MTRPQLPEIDVVVVAYGPEPELCDCLRSVLSFCNSPQMNAPEAYIQFTPGLITDSGEVTVESTEQFLRTYMAEFHMFIARVLQVLPKDA